MTEREYLDRQEDRTREALTGSAQRIETELCRAAPLEEVVRDHPVLSLGAGAAGGVAAGYLLGTLLGSRTSRAVLGALRVAARPALRRIRTVALDALLARTGTSDTAS